MSELTANDLRNTMYQETQNYIEFLKEVYNDLGDDHPMSGDILSRLESAEESFLNYNNAEEMDDFSFALHCRNLLEEEAEFCSGFTFSQVLGENATTLMEEKSSHLQSILDGLSDEWD